MNNKYLHVPGELPEELAPPGQGLPGASVIDNLVQKWHNEGYSDKEILEFIEILEAPD